MNKLWGLFICVQGEKSLACLRTYESNLQQSHALTICFPGCVLSSDLHVSYKGEGIVSGSLEKVWECLKPVPNGRRVKWDNNVKKFELLDQISEVS